MAKTVGDVSDLRNHRPAATEQFECCEALDGIQKGGAHAAENRPLTPSLHLRGVTDEHHKDGDERGGEQKHEGR